MAKTDNYRNEAQRLADEYARHFHAPIESMDGVKFADHSVREEMQTPEDRKVERQQKIWAEDARIQAEKFASERNAGRGGRVYISEEDKSILAEVTDFIRRTKLRGGLGGQKTLNKK